MILPVKDGVFDVRSPFISEFIVLKARFEWM